MASPSTPTAAYRAQNGIPEQGSYDPQVVSWVQQAAQATGADPAALLATSLQESGAQRGRVGDSGTSFGPFQFHRGGALGAHSPQWANTYDAILNRAQEFARLKVKGGVGAAAVQRPADPHLYAQGVDALLAQANEILRQHGAAPLGATPPSHGEVATAPGAAGSNPSADVGQGIIQAILDANAKLAGIEAPTLPGQSAGLGVTQPGTSAAPAATVPGLKPTGKVATGKIIGTPYAGTHNLGNWESDNAVDVALPVGTAIRAPAAGVIGPQIGSLGAAAGSRFAGLRVHLKTGNNELYLAHLSRLVVKAGEHVKAGQIIGYSGSANGVAHLHLGAKNGDPGRYA